MNLLIPILLIICAIFMTYYLLVKKETKNREIYSVKLGWYLITAIVGVFVPLQLQNIDIFYGLLLFLILVVEAMDNYRLYRKEKYKQVKKIYNLFVNKYSYRKKLLTNYGYKIDHNNQSLEIINLNSKGFGLQYYIDKKNNAIVVEDKIETSENQKKEVYFPIDKGNEAVKKKPVRDSKEYTLDEIVDEHYKYLKKIYNSTDNDTD